MFQNDDKWAQSIALRAALRALPYISHSGDDWLSEFGLLPFGALFSSWMQLTDSSIFLRTDANRANARFGGPSFDFKLYNSQLIAAHAAQACYHSADAQSRSPHVTSDCVKAVEEAVSAYRVDAKQKFGPDFGPSASLGTFWGSVASDCQHLSDWLGQDVEDQLINRPLWDQLFPYWIQNLQPRLKRKLIAIDPNYAVWIDWYERRIRGERAAFDIPGDKGRVEDKKILRRLAEATDEDFWGKGHEYVNATLKGWLDEARERAAPPEILGPAALPQTPAQIAAALQHQASPQAQIMDGKLDARPNTVFDKPQYSDNLADLPSELLAYTNTILNSLPTNCASIVRNCFTGFRDELLVRGNQPIVNILKAMATSLTAELYIESPADTPPHEWQLKDPREWGAGMDSIFGHFFKGYHDLIYHFPLDAEREALIATTSVDEIAASGSALTEPVDAVAALIIELGKQGFATDNIVRIVEAHQLYNRDVAQLPTPSQPSAAITPKRRHVLQTTGFYLHTYSILASTKELWPVFIVLAERLQVSINALLAFIK